MAALSTFTHLKTNSPSSEPQPEGHFRLDKSSPGDVDTVKSKRSSGLPIDPILIGRMEKLGKGKWVFRSRTGTPVNPGNALKRHVRPVAKELGISLGGRHDFRYTLSTKLRRWECIRKSSRISWAQKCEPRDGRLRPEGCAGPCAAALARSQRVVT